MRKTIPYLIRVEKAGGRALWYWQPSAKLRAAGWRPVRLAAAVEDAGLAEIAAEAEAKRINERLALWRAGDGALPEAPRRLTLDQVIEAYQASRAWRELAPKTRAAYGSAIRALRAWAGDQPVEALDVATVEDWLEQLHARTPAMAAAVARVFRTVWIWARKNVGGFPAVDFPGYEPAAGRQVEPRPWTRGDAAALARAARRRGLASIAGLIVAGFWLGQRQADLAGLAAQQVKGGVVARRQGKTAADVRLPLDACPGARAAVGRALGRRTIGPVFVCERTGRAWQPAHLSHVFAELRREAARTRPELADLRFAWLRHTAVTRMAEAGCTIEEISAVSGHSLPRAAGVMQRHYLLQREQVARRGLARRHAWEREQVRAGGHRDTVRAAV